MDRRLEQVSETDLLLNNSLLVISRLPVTNLVNERIGDLPPDDNHPASVSLEGAYTIAFQTSIRRRRSIHIARQPSGRRVKHVVPEDIPRSGRRVEDLQPTLQG